MNQSPIERPGIIYRPDLQSRSQRWFYRMLTTGAWVVWVYRFLPLISIVAWGLGIDYFARYMLEPGGAGYLFTLTTYTVVIAASALIIVGWSRYNQIRSRRYNRRSQPQPVSDEMIQERFFVSADDLARIHDSKIMVLELDDDGHVTRATTQVRLEPGRGFPRQKGPSAAAVD